jgi:FkbM family methyltransferase
MDKLFRHIKPKTLIDIGAHVGNFSKEMYYEVPECEIMMVEANKNCEPALRLLGKPYDIIALSDKEGTAELYIEKINPIATGASLYKENTEWYSEGAYETVQVKTATLDSRAYFDTRPIDLIKIDVQGSELDILKGGPETMKRTSYALIELSLAEYNLGAPLISQVIDQMIDYGFYMVNILEYHSFAHLYGGAIFQIDVLFKKF